MAYADGFLIPVPTKKIDAYREISARACAIWMEHGALDYKECVGDDLDVAGMTTTFPGLLNAKRGESVVFSWIVYKSRTHRDAVLKKVMADPRLDAPENCPFDPKRMAYGGFSVLVDSAAKRKAAAPKKAPVKKAASKKAR